MILDTNALSEYLKGQGAVVAIVSRQPQVFLPVIVLGEYRYGLVYSQWRTVLSDQLDEYERLFGILNIDAITARQYAMVRSELRDRGRPIPVNDVWIAALARQHTLPILSRDTHFDEAVGIQRIGW